MPFGKPYLLNLGMFKRLLMPLIVCLNFMAGLAQPQNLLFNHLNVNNGLSQGVNNCIYKDSRGYVWISSFDGLNRYDGISCTIFRENISDSFSLRGTLFLNIVEDKNGDLWIGSNRGLNCYRRKENRFYNFQMPDRDMEEQVFSPFYVDASQRIWFQSRSDLLLFDSRNKSFKSLHHFESPGNLVVKTTPAEQLKTLESLHVIANNSSEIYKGRIQNEKIDWSVLLKSTEANDQKFSSLLPLKNGIWIAGTKGILWYSNNRIEHKIEFYKNTPADDIRSLLIDHKGTLWAGSGSLGLFATDTASGQIVHHYSFSSNNPYSISGNRVQYLYTDAENHLWVSIWGKGIDYVSLEKFRFQHHLTREEAGALQLDNFIRSIVERKEGEIWCGTQLNGILLLDKNKKAIGSIRNGLSPAIEHLHKDKNSRIWIATFAGLFFCNSINSKPIRVEQSSRHSTPASDQFNFITEAEGNDLLLSTNSGLFLAKSSNNNYQLKLVKGLPAGDVYLTCYRHVDGSYFISRAFKGFLTGEIINDSFIPSKNFPYQATIKCFTPVNDNQIWIGTTIGLMKFNTKLQRVEKIYTTNEGLSNQYVYGVLAHEGSLWVSTNAGINRIDLSNDSVKTFTVGDGLQSNEFNTYSYCQTTNGEFLFGGVNGLNSFFPSKIGRYPHRPQLQLSSLLIDDKPVNAGFNPGEITELVLKPDENTVSFGFTALDYSNPNGNSVSYTLQPYDRNWITVPNKSTIRYANLPAGEYKLVAKALNSENLSAASNYELRLIVIPPWWRTWWFRLLAAFTIAAIVFLIIKEYFNRQLQKQRMLMEKELAIEQERTRMSRELHDGLGSMLSGIKHSFDSMSRQLDLSENQQLRFHANIDKLNESIRELRNISHSMASETLLQFGLEHSLRDYCDNTNNAGNLRVGFTSLNSSGLSLSEEQSFHIFRIVQELIQNVSKHAEAKNAIVQMSVNEDRLYITVEDDGRGFDSSKVAGNKGIGLKNIESRIRVLKGRMDFRSTTGEGTSVLLEIPIKS